jgi:5'-nucleotidase
VGGAARFATALRAQAASKPLVLFSGDVFNPSLMSTVTKGKVRPNRFLSCRPHHHMI